MIKRNKFGWEETKLKLKSWKTNEDIAFKREEVEEVLGKITTKFNKKGKPYLLYAVFPTKHKKGLALAAIFKGYMRILHSDISDEMQCSMFSVLAESAIKEGLKLSAKIREEKRKQDKETKPKDKKEAKK